MFWCRLVISGGAVGDLETWLVKWRLVDSQFGEIVNSQVSKRKYLIPLYFHLAEYEANNGFYSIFYTLINSFTGTPFDEEVNCSFVVDLSVELNISSFKRLLRFRKKRPLNCSFRSSGEKPVSLD
jgi:hypothetical protein